MCIDLLKVAMFPVVIWGFIIIGARLTGKGPH